MKPLVRTAASIFASIVASILVTWLLRRLVLTVEQPSASDGEQRSQVLVIMPIVIGNSFGPTIVPTRGKLPPGLARGPKRR